MQDYNDRREFTQNPGRGSHLGGCLPCPQPAHCTPAQGLRAWSLDQHHLGTQEGGKLSVPPQTYSVRIWGMGFPAISIFMCGLSLRIQPNEKIKYGHKYLCIITKMFISVLFT